MFGLRIAQTEGAKSWVRVFAALHPIDTAATCETAAAALDGFAGGSW